MLFSEKRKKEITPDMEEMTCWFLWHSETTSWEAASWYQWGDLWQKEKTEKGVYNHRKN